MVLTDSWAVTMDATVFPMEFLGPLRGLGKDGNWYVTFYRLPDGKRYDAGLHHAPGRGLYRQRRSHRAAN
jgi:hypothetical protein